MKNKLGLLLFQCLIISGCFGVIVVPVPITYNTPVVHSVFLKHNENFESNYTEKIDSLNRLVKSWIDFSVEITPKRNYIVKVYDNDLNQQISEITYHDENLIYKTGREIQWADDGSKIHEGFYMNGNKVHIWKYYSLINGNLEYEGKYLNNKRKGSLKKFNEKEEFVEEMDSSYREDLMKKSFNCDRVNTISNNYITENQITRQLLSCKGHQDKIKKRICTSNKLNEWIRIVRSDILEEKIMRTVNAIVLLEIKQDGGSSYKIIRGLNNKVREIIDSRLDDNSFKFEKVTDDSELEYIILNI